MARSLDNFQAFQTSQTSQTSQPFWLRDGRIVGRKLVHRVAEHRVVGLVRVDRKIGIRRLEGGDGADVVEMGVREENGRWGEIFAGEQREDAFALVARVDDPGLAILREDCAVDFEASDLNGGAFHAMYYTKIVSAAEVLKRRDERIWVFTGTTPTDVEDVAQVTTATEGRAYKATLRVAWAAVR